MGENNIVLEVKQTEPQAENKKSWKTWLFVCLFPFVILWGIAWLLNKMRFFEATIILGLGFYLGWRFGIGKLDPVAVYYLNMPCWVEILVCGLLFVIMGLKMMLAAKERIKLK